MSWLLCGMTLAAPLAIGYAVVRALWPEIERTRESALLQAALGVPLGYGLTSGIFYGWLSLWGPPGRGLAIMEAAAALAIAIWIGSRRREPERRPASARAGIAGAAYAAWSMAAGLALVGVLFRTPPQAGAILLEVLAFVGALALGRRILPPTAGDEGLLQTGACAVFAMAAASCVLGLLNEPHGSWDAWAIWNMRARFIFRDGAAWRDAFPQALAWSHPDYPLMLAGTVVNGWMALGRETLGVPAALSALFAGAVALLLYAAVAAMRGRSQGVLAALLLLSTDFFLRSSTGEIADVPLSLFCLATVVLLTLDEVAPARGRFALLAGLACGLGCWMKNDGLIFAVAVTVGWTAMRARDRGWRRAGRAATRFALGMLPGLLLLAAFRWAHPSVNPDMRYVPGSSLNLTRYATVARDLGRSLFWFGDSALPLPLVLLVYAGLMGGEPEPARQRALRAGAWTLAVVFAILFVVYLTTQYYQIPSWERLMSQHWPWVLFLAFLTLRSPFAPGARQENSRPVWNGGAP